MCFSDKGNLKYIFKLGYFDYFRLITYYEFIRYHVLIGHSSTYFYTLNHLHMSISYIFEICLKKLLVDYISFT